MTNKIMLVDSCNFDLVHTACSLEGEGYDVCTSSSRPERALDVALSESPDLIFLDYEHGGLDTCQALQANVKTRDIPVVIVSSVKTDKESTMLALKFGCIDFIQEGEKDSVVLNKLRTYLRISKIRALCNTINKKIGC